MKKSEHSLPIVVVVGLRSREADLHAVQLIEFLGAHVSQRRFTCDQEAEGFLEALLSGGPSALVLSASTLSEILRSTRGIEDTIGKLTSRIPLLFVYGWPSDAAEVELLPILTRGRVLGVSTIPSLQYFTIDGRYLGRGSGDVNIKVDCATGLPLYAFEVSDGKEAADIIIGIAAAPIFIRLPSMKCEIYLSSESRVACLETRLGAWPRLSSYLSGILPLTLLVREIAGRECWRPLRSLACLTIDDPPLVAEYGYLSYQRLLDEMQGMEMHVCCGVIPWNYRRSQSAVIRLFLDNPGKLSIAYHGCDHTRREFGHVRHEILSSLVSTAKERMDTHHRSTGLRCDDLMIFPQHSYSTEAIRVLSNAGMLGATSGNIIPVDIEHLLTLGDLMQPAMSRFYDFPIFSRTYMDQESEILLYSLLGKPIVICLHHDAFRKGYAALGNLARFVGSLCPSIEWIGLEQMATRCCQVRENQSCGIEVRFFSRRFSIRNPFEHQTRVRFLKRESSPNKIAHVTLDSRDWSWDWDNELLSIHATLEPTAKTDVEICYNSLSTGPIGSRSLAYEVGVWARRRMCEMRDTLVSQLRKG